MSTERVIQIWKTRLAVVAILFMIAILLPTPAFAAGPIVLDGQFSDWDGQMYINDPIGDVSDANGDIVALYWANNPDEDAIYWMIERVPSDKKIDYLVYVDTNNNGYFRDHVDRIVQVVYLPHKDSSDVIVVVRYGDDTKKISQTEKQNWGDSADAGGRRVEFKAVFADLGITVGQTIRMYAVSFFERLGWALEEKWDTWELPGWIDRIPDTGDIQWTPIPLLGYWGVVVAIVGIVAVWYLGKRFKWFRS